MPPTILYLIGTPYCGSTVFGAILGQHPQIANVGELGYWTTKTRDPSLRTCACGQSLRDCEFWSQVREKWLRAAGLSDTSSYRTLQQKYEVTSLWLFLQRKSLPKRTDFQEYTRLTRLLMETIADVSGKSYIFDTTKSPGRAVALAATGLDVIPLQMVRSGPRFIASSINRRIRRKKSGNPEDVFFIIETGMRWLFTNLVAEMVCSAAPPSATRVLYENVIAHPRETITNTGAALGIDLHQVADIVASGESFGFGHAVDGSLVRLDGPTTLKPPSEKPVSTRIEWIFNLTAGWLARRYGYSK